ncbi:MAG: FtsQ-type POTRA domain-containing protein [Ruminococcus sp.]|nr:FtsQ-type POTRA domain-containing protein [Candidatus Copronaster equi]
MKELTPNQLKKLPEQKRNAYLKQLKKVKRNRKTAVFVISFIVIIAALALLSVTVLFNIKQINVKPEGSYYEAQEIINASGLDTDDNIIRTDFSAVEKRICKNLPYILSVKFKKSIFSGVVTIAVTDDEEKLIFKSADGYVLCDENCKMLRQYSELPNDNNLITVKMKNSVVFKPGEKVLFSDSSQEKALTDTLKAIEKAEFKNVTKIDISDSDSIKVDYQNRFRLLLGDNVKLYEKFLEAKKVIAQEDKSDSSTIGEIDLTILKKVFVNPKDYLDPTSATTVEETTTSADNEDEEEISEEETDEENSDEEEN